MRIIELVRVGDSWETHIDGVPHQGRCNIRESISAPHPAVYMDGVPQYDLEYWVDGQLHGRIPPLSDATAAVYSAYESDDWSEVPAHGDDGDSSQVAQVSRWMAADEAVRQSEGFHVVAVWSRLFKFYDVHHRNAVELFTLVNNIEATLEVRSDLMGTNGTGDSFGEAMNALTQRLHNFVASAGSLVGQATRILKSYQGTEFASEYDRRKEDLISAPVVGFVKDLRNYAMHENLPSIGRRVKLGPGVEQPAMVLHLSTAHLASASREWSTKSREFMGAAGDYIDLRTCIDEYQQLIAEFYGWLIPRAHEWHVKEIAELERLTQSRSELHQHLSNQGPVASMTPTAPFEIVFEPPY